MRRKKNKNITVGMVFYFIFSLFRKLQSAGLFLLQGGTSVVVPYCSCCLCLYFGSSIMLVTYFVNFR